MKWSELEEAYNSCIIGTEKPVGMVASTKWLHLNGVDVEGPGPWLVTNRGIISIAQGILEDLLKEENNAKG